MITDVLRLDLAHVRSEILHVMVYYTVEKYMTIEDKMLLTKCTIHYKLGESGQQRQATHRANYFSCLTLVH